MRPRLSGKARMRAALKKAGWKRPSARGAETWVDPRNRTLHSLTGASAVERERGKRPALEELDVHAAPELGELGMTACRVKIRWCDVSCSRSTTSCTAEERIVIDGNGKPDEEELASLEASLQAAGWTPIGFVPSGKENIPGIYKAERAGTRVVTQSSTTPRGLHGAIEAFERHERASIAHAPQDRDGPKATVPQSGHR
jgi:hypothetical protein